jgi:hypothetical protein
VKTSKVDVRFFYNIAHPGFITVIRGVFQVELKIRMKALTKLLCEKRTKRPEFAQTI